MDLTSLSQTARKAIVIFAFGVVALIIIYAAVRLAVSLINNLTPEPPPVANRVFGDLVPIKFESSSANSSKYTFTLETVDAQLPITPPLFKVYQLKRPPSLFQGLEQAKKRASDFSFKSEPVALSSSLYQFRDPEKPGYSFSLDVISGDYHLILDPSVGSQELNTRLSIDNSEAVNRARTYLKNRDSLSPAFENGNNTVQYFNITPKQTTKVTSPSQGNAFRVDFYPSAIEEKYQVLGEHPDSSPVNVTLLASDRGQEKVFEINYQQFEIDFDNTATYNIKDSGLAWEELQKGLGTVLKAPKANGQVAINNISLGYFMELGSKYLKPIYIFEGTSSVDQLKPDFIAVLPAIAVENKAK